MESQVSFNQVVSRGCGIDVHKKMLVATISGEGLNTETREFGTVTRSLTELKDWLLENRVTHVVMESTGVYWKPVYHVLEPSGLTVWIVNARHVKNVPGHKTDKQDSRWLCKLLLAGLLKPSYIPPRERTEVCEVAGGISIRNLANLCSTMSPLGGVECGCNPRHSPTSRRRVKQRGAGLTRYRSKLVESPRTKPYHPHLEDAM